MSYEVELKFPVPDLPAFAGNWPIEAVPISPAQEEIDLYFAHPARDFAADGRGPAPAPQGRGELHHLQRSEDRRHDQDPPRDRTAAGARGRNRWPPGRPCWKRSVSGRWARSASPAARPRSLGKAARSRPPWTKSTGVGTFVEFELVAEESEVEAARACIQSLAQSFGLTQGERRSYLELLLKGK